MPFNFTVANPQGKGNLHLVCKFERLPEDNVIIPNDLHFKEYVRNSEVVEKWAASAVISSHRKASVKEKQNAQLLSNYLLQRDYSARARRSSGSVFLRTLPIDQLIDGDEGRLLCCFRQPLKRENSCGSAESSNQTSSSDDREQTPMSEDAIVRQATDCLNLSSHHQANSNDGCLEDTVSFTAPVSDCMTITSSTLSYRIKYPSVKNKEATLQEPRDGLGTVKKGTMEVNHFKCEKRHEFNSQETLKSPWICSEHPDPRQRPCISRHKGFHDFKRHVENTNSLKKDPDLPTVKKVATAEPDIRVYRQTGDAKEQCHKNMTKKDTQQFQSDPANKVHYSEGADHDAEAVLASWRAKVRLLDMAHSCTRNHSSSERWSKLQSKPHHPSRRKDKSIVKSTNKHDGQKARLAHSKLWKDSKRVQYEAPVKDKQVHTKVALKKTKEKPPKSSRARKRDLVKKRVQKHAKDLCDTSTLNCIHEEIVRTKVDVIDEEMDTSIAQESSGSVHIASQPIYDLDEITNIGYLF